MDDKTAYNAVRKMRRALSRFYLGKKLSGDYLLVTLTTPEGQEIDLHRAWRKFVMRLRRRGIGREYFAVREWNKRGTCQHLHVVFRARYMDIEILRQQWEQVTAARWIHLDRVYGGNKGIARYLAKYLVKGSVNGPEPRFISDERLPTHGYYAKLGRLYWYAYQWIFRGWRAYNYIAYRINKLVDYQKWHDCVDRNPQLLIAILSQWRWVAKLSWSITLAKALRQVGIIWDGVNYGTN